MPGIGKSETARMYVSKWKADYANFIWINAKTPDLIDQSFSRVSQQYKLTFNNLEMPKKDTKSLAREVYKKLCQLRLLIVFDGAHSWDSEDGIQEFLPMDIKTGWKTPDIIVTSRNRIWKNMNVIEVEDLCFEDCHQLLSRLLNSHAHTDTWILSFLVYWRYGGLPIVAQQFVLNYERSSQSQISMCKKYFDALCNYKNFLNTPVWETELQSKIFRLLEDMFQELTTFRNAEKSYDTSSKVDVKPYINNGLALANQEYLDQNDEERAKLLAEVEKLAQFDSEFNSEPTDFRATTFKSINKGQINANQSLNLLSIMLLR
ncbi:unnamed protein product [Allacma fusca]|uniref:NB-ARC domain-containing protein n=1 Tax=Allacma fusca TaxID=39272 RepID=A0A8J2JJA0_9HEXA|nr:unnamed protein product [Allacma fusca]